MSLNGNGLPKGWESVRLGDVIQLKYGKSLPAKNRDNVGFPVYGSNGVVGKHSTALIEEPAIIVGRKGSIGEAHLAESPCSPIDTTYYVNEFFEQPPEYWLYQIRALNLADLNRATALPGLNREDAYRKKIGLPPLAEQRRIVAKIEALQARSRRARAALETIPPLLERFRQSVLAAAFRGDLTKDWREQHQHKLEPAEALLERIRTERRQKWEQAQRAKYEAKGQAPPKGWKDKYQEPEPPDTSDLPELPEGWCWANLGQLTLIDSGEAFKKREYVEDGVRLVQIANVGFGETIWKQRNFLPESYIELFPHLVMQESDIVLALNRPILDDVLKVSLIEMEDTPSILYQRVGRLRPAWPDMGKLLLHFMRGPTMLSQVKERLQGTDQPYLNTSLVPSIVVPLPGEVEIRRISVSLDRALGELFNIEDIILESEANLAALDQAILSKAFRGELVPQDPNDEPATALLARIRAERDKAQKISKAKRRVKPKQASSC